MFPGRWGCNFRIAIYSLILLIGMFRSSSDAYHGTLLVVFFIGSGVRRYFDPPIYWPQGQYIVTIFWPPSRYFDPPPNSTQNSLDGYDQLLNVAFCYLYCNIYEFWEDRLGVEQVYQNKMRWWLVSCFHLQQVKPFITLWNHVMVVQNESIINTLEIINMNVKKITHLM